MRIRLYMDEDAMGWRLVVALRAHGMDIVTAHEAGTTEFSDEQQLIYATEQGRVIYSFNVKDFHALHTQFLEQGLSHAGIILTHQRHYSVGEQMRRVLRLTAHKSAEEMVDQAEFLNKWG